MFKVWRERLATTAHRAARVATGPRAGEVHEGADVDLTRFPVPRWHEQDGGPYFGTGCASSPDPRRALGERRHLPLHAPRRPDHGHRHRAVPPRQPAHAEVVGARRELRRRRRDQPRAVSLLGVDRRACPGAAGEYDFAGFIKGEPLEVVRGPRTRLPLPANAELIIEGEVPPPDVEQRRRARLASSPATTPAVRRCGRCSASRRCTTAPTRSCTASRR